MNHRNYTKAFVSSETDIPFYGEAFGIKEQNIIPTGVPRTDTLFDEQYEQQIVAEMEAELPIIQGKKLCSLHQPLEEMVIIQRIIHSLRSTLHAWHNIAKQIRL